MVLLGCCHERAADYLNRHRVCVLTYAEMDPLQTLTLRFKKQQKKKKMQGELSLQLFPGLRLHIRRSAGNRNAAPAASGNWNVCTSLCSTTE